MTNLLIGQRLKLHAFGPGIVTKVYVHKETKELVCDVKFERTNWQQGARVLNLSMRYARGGGCMNCKQGDLAIVANVTSPEVIPYLGRIVRCVRLGGRFNECWITDPELQPSRPVYDGCLRPINNPGDDAQDETLTWLDVPGKVTA